MKKGLFIWSICCEIISVGCAFISQYVPTIIFFSIGILSPIFGYLKERERTKQLKNAEDSNTDRKRIESETRIEEMKIIRDTVLGIATISSPKTEELEKHNQDNLLYFEDTAKKRMTQIISEPENDADKSLPAYYENLKEDISDNTTGFINKSMLQNLLKKDDNNET